MRYVSQDQPKGIKGYNKVHKAQDGIKTLDIIRGVVCGVEAHLQETWSMMKSNKILYTFFQGSNTIKYDYVKEFEAYIQFLKSYGGKTPIHPVLVKAKLANM